MPERLALLQGNRFFPGDAASPHALSHLNSSGSFLTDQLVAAAVWFSFGCFFGSGVGFFICFLTHTLLLPEFCTYSHGKHQQEQAVI